MVYPFACRHVGAKCLGTYERELHRTIEEVIGRNYDTVLNLGCAEGYYAVGLARRMRAQIVAVDYNPYMLALCRALAAANAIDASRIRYRLEATHELLAEAVVGHTFVLTDVEGAELHLLDPVAAPSLLETDILVELHERAASSIEDILRRRFSESHEITAIDSEPRDETIIYPELRLMSARRRMLALVERPFPMRWLVLMRRPATRSGPDRALWASSSPK